jgi:NAD(P)-dependent dehydrogenase (short-subunit alcohol dehydrogenase family)
MTSSSSPGVIVAACGRGPATHLARTWAARGRSVVLIGDAESSSAPNLTPVRCDFASTAAVEAAFADAVRTLGPVHEVVYSALPAAALTCQELDGLPLERWQAASHGCVKPVLYGLQAAARQLPAPLAFTLLGPHVSLTGAAGGVALCTGVEAQRSLAKAAARQWGRRGIRVNWVSIAAPEFDPAFGDWVLPEVPELGPPPPALGRRIELDGDVLPVLEFLGGPAARGMTGLTINLDGGDWMLP